MAVTRCQYRGWSACRGGVCPTPCDTRFWKHYLPLRSVTNLGQEQNPCIMFLLCFKKSKVLFTFCFLLTKRNSKKVACRISDLIMQIQNHSSYYFEQVKKLLYIIRNDLKHFKALTLRFYTARNQLDSLNYTRVQLSAWIITSCRGCDRKSSVTGDWISLTVDEMPDYFVFKTVSGCKNVTETWSVACAQIESGFQFRFHKGVDFPVWLTAEVASKSSV